MRHTRSAHHALGALAMLGALACEGEAREVPAPEPNSGVEAPTAQPGEDTLAWEESGEVEECEVDALLPAHVGARRVKNLLTGLPLTPEELEAIQQDPERLREHVEAWIATPEFDTKLWDFLKATLQQTDATRPDYGTQHSNVEGLAGFSAPDALWDNLNESFVRTAMDIVERGRPFHEIASTRTWMMTTGMMAYLVHSDRFEGPSMRFYHEPFTDGGVTYDANTPRSVQIENATFYSTAALEGDGCSDPFQVGGAAGLTRGPKRATFTTFMIGRAPNVNNFCTPTRPQIAFEDADFEDWRLVTMTRQPLNEPREIQYYDSPSLRAMDTLPLTIDRTGFFMSPSFLAGWRTNADNSFRVTTNQTLITGLGLAFEDTDTTTPLGDDGLAADHASPSTACYSCHKNLDPMRNYFDVVFLPDTYAARRLGTRPEVEPSFSFQGYAAPGDTLEDLGRIIAEHPYFSSGWAQKLCMYANSQPCDEQDPEFGRVVQAFEDANYDFEVLVAELFSSRLVTGAACAGGDEGSFSTVSVARYEHLCRVLATRLEREGICAENFVIEDLANALPATDWPRGATVPAMPTEPSLFYAAGEKSLCKDIASVSVDARDSRLQSSDMEGSIDYLVEVLMGVLPTDPRHEAVHALMTRHVEDAREVTEDPAERLQSAFVVACTSPFVTSTDF